jgi:hypothetical protein
VEGQDNQVEEEATIDGLAKKYPWWSPQASEERTTEPEERASELQGHLKERRVFCEERLTNCQHQQGSVPD